MAEPTESKKKQYERFKSKVSIHNLSKYQNKPKVRYGAYVDKICAGYWHNGVWRVQI